jgi:hypothetical protein
VNFKCIYLFLLCLVFKLNIAQVYFNNRYDNYNNGDITTGINLFHGGYLIYGCAANSFSFYSLNLGIVDYTGIRIKNRTYNWGSNLIVPNINKCIINSNSYFTIGGTNFYKPDTSLVFSWKFNENLDSLEYHEFGFVNMTNQLNGIVKDPDKYIYMTGWVDSLYKNSDILLIKADTSGNEIWKKKIGLPNYDEGALCIKKCANGNLLIGGYKTMHGTSTQGPFIMRLDSSGAILWQNFYPSATYANGSFDVMELPNGDIVFTGGKAYAITAQGTLRRPMLTKVDAGGNLIWQKEYGEKAVAHDFFTFLLNEKNNFVVSGVKAFIDNSCNGMVYEINQNGDSLFSREYAVQSGSQNYFRDLVQAPDKGYVFSGFISPLFANGGTGNQDIWLLKTDSTFCEAAFNCGYPTSIAEAEALEAGEMSVYPNPANTVVNFIFTHEVQGRKIKLYDAVGNLIYTCDASSKNLTLTTDNLTSGIYFYKAVTGDKISQNKLVIIK